MRVLPPVHSPLTAASLVRGLDPRARTVALRAVEERIQDAYAPVELRLTDTGTSALRLALEVATATPNGAVALPAYGCYDLVSAARGARVRCIYYDVDPLTLGPDLPSLRKALEDGAGAVVIAYLYGVPADLARIRELCDAHGALLIEDSAQGLGGTYGDRPLGANGDLSILSFGRGKGRTGGGGGALLANTTRGERVMAGVGVLSSPPGNARTVARAAVQWALGRPVAYGLPSSLPFLHLGETRYREPHAATGMAAEGAAILDAVWDASEMECRIRRKRGEAYQMAMRGVPGLSLPRIPSGAAAGYLRFPVLLQCPRPELVEEGRRFGVVRGYPGLLSTVCPVAGDRTAGDLAGAELLVEGLWTLPTHRYVRDDDQSRIVALLTAAA